jgi:hypothetical protein
MHPQRYYDNEDDDDDNQPHPSSSGAAHNLEVSTDGIQPAADDTSAHAIHENVAPQQGGIIDVDLEPTVRARLLHHQNWDAASGCSDPNCNHDTTASRPHTHRNYGSFAGSISSMNSFRGTYAGHTEAAEADAANAAHPLLGDVPAGEHHHGGNGQNKSTTKWLAERHGVKNQRLMFVD